MLLCQEGSRKVCIMEGVPTVEKSKPSNRLVTLDHLRGFFIVVIIVDHLSRWPSLFALISGKALLWITAAEGFVIISGLLIGYVRGFKNRHLAMTEVTKKLLGRAGLLYLWSIIGTLAYTAILWYIPLQGGAPGLLFDRGDWWNVFIQVATFQTPFVWVHFLTLYALFLAASPLAVWLLRHNKAWLVVALSLGLLVIGWQTHIEALQWQALFFIPSVAGYYLEHIQTKWQKLATHVRLRLTTLTLAVTGVTLALSIIATFYPNLINDLASYLNSLFAKDTISIWRLVLAFVWFVGFLLLFNLAKRWIGKWLGWLLLPIGTRSLTAYILHGLVIVVVSYFTIAGDNLLINSLLGLFAILGVWALLRLPFVEKVIPR